MSQCGDAEASWEVMKQKPKDPTSRSQIKKANKQTNTQQRGTEHTNTQAKQQEHQTNRGTNQF